MSNLWHTSNRTSREPNQEITTPHFHFLYRIPRISRNYLHVVLHSDIYEMHQKSSIAVVTHLTLAPRPFPGSPTGTLPGSPASSSPTAYRQLRAVKLGGKLTLGDGENGRVVQMVQFELRFLGLSLPFFAVSFHVMDIDIFIAHRF